MKTRWLPLVISVFLISTLAASGCRRVEGEPATTVISGTPVPVTKLANPPPTNSAEAPDDIVFTPGGSAYRANVHEQGVPDKWPEVQTVEARLSANTSAIFVAYRDSITTKGGEVRNNLFNIRQAEGHFLDTTPHTVDLFIFGAPPGMTFYQGSAGGLPGTLATLLIIEVPQTLAAGRHSFGIIVLIDGVNYGALGCTVDVTG